MKTERLSILVTPEDKARIFASAARLHLSAGELVRRAVSAYEPDNVKDNEELRELVSALGRAVAHAEQRLDETLARIDTFDNRLRQARQNAEAEVRQEGTSWPFQPAPRDKSAA